MARRCRRRVGWALCRVTGRLDGLLVVLRGPDGCIGALRKLSGYPLEGDK